MELGSEYVLDMGVLIAHICNHMRVKFIDLWQTCFELRIYAIGHVSNQRIDLMHWCVEILSRTAQVLSAQHIDFVTITLV